MLTGVDAILWRADIFFTFYGSEKQQIKPNLL